MNMLARKTEIAPSAAPRIEPPPFAGQLIEPPPFAGQLQAAVSRLAEILAPADRGADDYAAARAEFNAAISAREKASADCDAVCRRYGAKAGHVDAPQVVVGRQNLGDAEARCKSARRELARAKERRAAAFARDVAPQVAEAAPIFLRVAALLNEAIAPLGKLHVHALNNDLPAPRMVALAGGMQEATRALTALLNRATEPPALPDEDDDFK
jgi:hypothetical protein